jgi:short-chain fatty acids transporter
LLLKSGEKAESVPLFEKMGYGISRNIERWFPDPFIFALVLLFVVIILAGIIQWRGPMLLVKDMYQGFWSFLTFAMQMCIIMVSGYALAYHPRVHRAIAWLCTLPKNGKQAAALIAFISCVFSWINWGLGLIIGACIAREMGRQAYFRKMPVHYPLLCTAGYAGMGLIWHYGLSGSAPLLSNTKGHFLESIIGVVPLNQTIFSAYALWNSLIILVFGIAVCYLMHPAPSRARGIEHYAPQLIESEEENTSAKPKTRSLAEQLENSRLIALGTIILMVGCMVYWFGTNGFMAGLDLNAVNFCFILLGLILYLNPIAYMRAVFNAAEAVGGIILQFPIYAGIQGIMLYSGLGATLANYLAQASNSFAFPAMVWFVAGLGSIVVPSGGGGWLVIGETISKVGTALHVPAGKFILAYGAGDTWTNLFNPFWAIPVLAITQVKARDMFGFCIAIMLLAMVPYALGLTFVPY